MDKKNPFAVLDLAATLDVATIKRAYFSALKNHPPHQSREGFARIRGAYETLMHGESRMAAYLATPLDLTADLLRYEQRFGCQLAEATKQRAQQAAQANAMAAVTSLSWSQALASHR